MKSIPFRSWCAQAILCGFGLAALGWGVPAARAVSSSLVIAEVYGGGGLATPPSVYQSDYVVLFNRGSVAQNVAGWSLQYASAAGVTWNNRVNLPDALVPPGGCFLVRLGSSGTTGAALPLADVTNAAINISASAGKLALVSTTTALVGACPSDVSIVDFVGYGGTATCFETVAAPGHSNTNCARRLNAGCTDTDHNTNDFVLAPCTPRGSAAPLQPCAVPAAKHWFAANLLPPPDGMYVSPAQFHAVFQNGLILSNAAHRLFTQSTPPPVAGVPLQHSFGSLIEMEFSADGGHSFQPVTVQANLTVGARFVADVASVAEYQNEMLSFSLQGTLGAIQIRESPTLASTGLTHIQAAPGGFMIDSFFDIFIEVSLDGGQTWSPALQPIRMELKPDPQTVPATVSQLQVLPPPLAQYVTPLGVHQLYPNGLSLREVRHKLFTQSILPPAFGASATHTFDSQVDFQVSLDGGLHFLSARAPAAVTVRIGHVRDFQGIASFDTEMLALNVSGGDLPAGVMIRESPTRASSGGTSLMPVLGGWTVNSFFDIFTEVSTDGGQTWLPATNGPARLQAEAISPIEAFPDVNLPPPLSQYVSLPRWHALFPNGLLLSNVVHRSFSGSFVPPLPGLTESHSFYSYVDMMVSMDGGATFDPVTAPAAVSVGLRYQGGDGATTYFDTEMLALDVQGGGLPANVMIRESPTKASLGRVSEEAVVGGTARISSFFDIFTEVSTDGGQTWLPAVNGPATVALQTAGPIAPLSLVCPSNLTVTATSPDGAVVEYQVQVVGGTSAVALRCEPPSGATFPIGITAVTCLATDAALHQDTCSFKVRVRPPPQWIFFPDKTLPPLNAMYLSPRQWHAVYENGLVVSNIIHRGFTQGLLPPSPGATLTHSFGSQVEMQVSTDGGSLYQPAAGPADVQVRISNLSATGEETYQTEMLQLNLQGGTLPVGVMIRESPTRASSGETSLRAVPGGYMISSFFDIFTEVSLDGGLTWSPATDPVTVQLWPDPTAVPSVATPSVLLPPPVDQYVSPSGRHALFASGIILRDIRHKLFSLSVPPVPWAQTSTDSFDSQVEMQVSMDGGQHWQLLRAPAAVQVRQTHLQDSAGVAYFDTEMLALNIAGGDLPVGVMIRESPTLPSRGATSLRASDTGGAMISSFFDIFTEVSTDAGGSWAPATNGPARVELQAGAPSNLFPDPNLPPLIGRYTSPFQWHAYYAPGLILSNVVHRGFTQSFPPPPPGDTASHSFGSQVEMDVSMDGGATFAHLTAPADVTVSINARQQAGSVFYYDTEMLQLDLHGGGLPAGVMIRESPTRASLGRVSQAALDGGAQRVSSFFDIFTEVSLDGGQSWYPGLSGPGKVTLGLDVYMPVTIICPSGFKVPATSSSGAKVVYPLPATSGGCPPTPGATCSPPSGSTFPIGATTVTCQAADTCGQSASCSFVIVVEPDLRPARFYRANLLPPPDGMYVSASGVHASFANGVVLSNVAHRLFSASVLPPSAGAPLQHSFGSQVEMEVSTDGGVTFQPVLAQADITVLAQYTGTVNGEDQYQNEMLSFAISAGSSAKSSSCCMIRESPTRASSGQTHVKAVPGGFMIDSFFDIFVEISLDGGQSWSPALDAVHMELQVDPQSVPAMASQVQMLPPPLAQYVSPQSWHQAYPNGLLVREVRHKLFTQSLLPPAFGPSTVHVFDSQVDFLVSTDGGLHFTPARAPATVAVKILRSRTFQHVDSYDTEMLQLDIAGGDLPAGVFIRESPTLASAGGTCLTPIGGGGGGSMINSFFDIFTEVSTDGGQSWLAATNGPARLQAEPMAPIRPFPDRTLPPLTGRYVTPGQWHAYYPPGIILSNVVHRLFSATFPLPGQGLSETHRFGSVVDMLVSINGGQTFQPLSAPADVTVRVAYAASDGSATSYDTEMLQLDLRGGGLPAGVMIRESPTRASLGRVTAQALPTGSARLSSFFDIFTEVSLDGGQTWIPALNGPASVFLQSPPPRLDIRLDGQDIVLWWLDPLDEFVLQETAALGPSADWGKPSGLLVKQGDYRSIRLPARYLARFFRLAGGSQ